MTPTAQLLRGLLRVLIKPVLGAQVPIRWQRASLPLARPLSRIPVSSKFQRASLNGVAVEIAGEAAGDAAILYLHGGGYCIGSPRSHRPITARLALNSGLPVYAPDYRLAPEHPFPAAFDDVLAVYHALRARGVTRIVLGGDSAGGGLALAAAIEIVRSGLGRPAALYLISPWVDLACDSASHRTQAARDPMLGPAGLRRWAQAYLGGQPGFHPSCSPLFGDLRGLPPVLIQAGSEEVLLDDCKRLELGLRAAAVPVQLRVSEGLWHVYPLNAGLLPDADAALNEAADFLRRSLA